MISRDRRTELLFEIMSETKSGHSDSFLPIYDYNKSRIITKIDPNFILQDRFSLELKSAKKTLDHGRIKGFRIDSDGEHQTIKVKTFLHIEDWLKDFRDIEIIRIYFFDYNGNVTNHSFDYDVDFKRFYLNCDYKLQDYLTPIYEYLIFDQPKVK